MAQHPSKFVSVNLNKSYGPQPPGASSSSSSSGHGRIRPGSGGGMVLLSRPRGSGSAAPKGAPRLAVPAPLNLPSLRKEHERLDPSAGPGTSSGPGHSGSGHGPSAVGWTKPSLPLQLAQKPAAQSSLTAFPSVSAVEKAVLLRGEDFPSLSATVASEQKQREFISQRQKQKQPEGDERRESSFPLHMRPQMRSSRLVASTASGEDQEPSQPVSALGPSRKPDSLLPGPLPVIRLAHTSDWADDERDTGLTIPERDHNHVFVKTGPNRELDLPNGRTARKIEVGGGLSRDFFRGDSFGRDLSAPNVESWDVSSWRLRLQQRDGLRSRESRADRIGAMPVALTREMNEGNSYRYTHYANNAQDGFGNRVQDSWHIRRDFGAATGPQSGRNVAETFNARGSEQNNCSRFGDSSHGWFKKDTFQSSTVLKGSFSSGSRGFSLNDPILNFGREKQLISNSGKQYLEDAGLDCTDLLSDVNVKVVKRKKEMVKRTDFHDPVRESFEAELERVQRIQEQERQRAMEEQVRALELARKEQEERERLAREELERRRRLEEEAREAAWKAEQERLEAARRVEEQKIAREEEKRRILLEEERRREAAKQKLLELEARIARRHAESSLKDDKILTTVGDEQVPVSAKERDVLSIAEVGDWEDGERMVEHITTSTLSDSSSINRFFGTGSRPISSRDGNSSAFMERGKQANYWRRDVYDNGNSSVFHMQDQENIYHSPRRDAFIPGRGYPRREFHGSPSMMSTRPSSKGGRQEPSQMPDDLRPLRGDRWNHLSAGYSDHFNRDSAVDAELLDDDKFGEDGWGLDHSHGNPHAPYGERLFQSSDVDGFSSFGRSRHSLRQPRVLPPPSISSIHRTSLRGTIEYPNSSSFLVNELQYQHARRNEEEILQTGYEGGMQECLRQPGSTALLAENAILTQQEEKSSPRCDSQSSLSVSSPPSSPTHLSHDDLDESRDSLAPPTPAVGEQTVVTNNEHVASSLEVGEIQIMVTSNSVSLEEDDEWAIENNEEMQEQDEYDEEDDGYREEDDAHEDDDDENLELVQGLEDLPLDLQKETSQLDQLVDFNEGLDVKLPDSDEFERTSRESEKAITIQSVPVHAVQELISKGVDSLQSEIHLEESVDESSNIINETEKSLQGLILDPVLSTSYLPKYVEAPGGSAEMQVQQSISPALSLPTLSTPSVHPISSSCTTGASQADVPVKLQFGLFSGPSLIPTPVPAIQIGSIQMPLHIHPQTGHSITQMHPSQPPIFQFGQLRYTPPISQGVLQLAPQTLSVVQPAASAHYSLNQNLRGPIHSQTNVDSSPHNIIGDRLHSLPADKLLGLRTIPTDATQDSLDCKQLHVMPDDSKSEVLSSHNNIDSPTIVQSRTGHVPASRAERHVSHGFTMKKNYRPVSNNRDLQAQLHTEPILCQLFPQERAQSGSRAPGLVSGGRGRRLAYPMRHAGVKSSFPGEKTLQTNSSRFHRRSRRSIRRTEFRVRDSAERSQTEDPESSNSAGKDEKPSSTRRVSEASAKYGGSKDADLNTSNEVIESGKLNSGVSASRVVGQEIGRSVGKEAVSRRLMPSIDNSCGSEGKKNGNLDEDVDAPLQSGVVRVFKQPGIETPSDEDDFIEVRSKRQMLNDRREQREKEIKARSRIIKTSRKYHAVSQGSSATTAISNRAVASLAGVMSGMCCDPVVTDARSLAKADPSPVFTANLASQTLPPIGTPVVNADTVTRSISLKSSQTTVSATSNGGTKLVPGLSFENKKTAFDNLSTPLLSWDNANINQQVMALTQTQLDEAMKPACMESHEDSSLETSKQASSIMMEPNTSSTSVMVQENLFSSSASPLKSLLAGEKIQFGAVTSPTILPQVTQSVSNGVVPPGLCGSDVSIDHNLPRTNNDCTIFYDKEKQQDDSCAHLEDPEAKAEAEAEAAASAVAVAAISNSDEMVGNRLSVSVSDSKSFGAPDAVLTSGGMTAAQEVKGQSASEESLTVALPADLSVDTPSLPLWPPLPSPQSSSGPIFSHFPGASPSHFPCFEMNPMIGAPIFSFGPHDESVGTQSRVQRSTAMGSGPLGPWPQCHSGVDSFYGPPAGFAGPFMSPGGIPGVQGPPQMVVYNHFTPVGQFGQVGLSFMGATYIPTGKQPDWKHNPVSSAVGVSEGDAGDINVVKGQRNPSSMPPLQHMAPGSPLMPMPSPLAMLDMSPFQSSAEVQMQARWSHIPAPPLYAVPLTVPLQQPQIDGGMPSKLSYNIPIEIKPSTGTNRFNESCSPTPVDASKNIPVSNDAASQFPDELVLVDPPVACTAPVWNIQPSYSPTSANDHKEPNNNKSPLRSIPPNANQSSGPVTDNNNSCQSTGSSSKPQATKPPASLQQYLHQTGHDQRGVGASKKTGAGGEWQHRMGFHARNQSLGAEKSFGFSKVKQMYVAKQPANGPGNPG